MDHSHMDHGAHGGHGAHEGHDMPGMSPQCNMNMLFTWDTTDLCIVFKGWHISGTGSLLVSLIAIVLLTAGYEAVREASRRYEAHVKRASEIRSSGDDLSNDAATTPAFHDDEDADLDADESSSLLVPGRHAVKPGAEKQAKLVQAAFYAVQVFYSFFIMLLFMTYNGWVMLAVALGAFVGYLLFSGSPATKTAACH